MFHSTTVTSFKGGVGKSTVAAYLGDALSARGKKILLVDCDVTNRCLDLILGAQDAVLSDLSDYERSGPPLSSYLTEIGGKDGKLFLLAAPYEEGAGESLPGKDLFASLLAEAEKDGFDRVIFDTPGDAGQITRDAASVCDSAVVVAANRATSVRGAEKTAACLAGWGVENVSLVLNFFEPRRGGAEALSPAGLIDRISIPLLGIVPQDRGLVSLQEKGLLPSSEKKKAQNARAAFSNMARRLEGESVPLLTSFKGIDRAEWLS